MGELCPPLLALGPWPLSTIAGKFLPQSTNGSRSGPVLSSMVIPRPVERLQVTFKGTSAKGGGSILSKRESEIVM